MSVFGRAKSFRKKKKQAWNCLDNLILLNYWVKNVLVYFCYFWLKTPFGETPWLTERHVTPLLSLFFWYRECYGFKRAFFTPRRFLPYTPCAGFKACPGPAVQLDISADRNFRGPFQKNRFRHLKLYSNPPSCLARSRCHMGTVWKKKDWSSHFWESQPFRFWYVEVHCQRRLKSTKTGISS